MIGIVPLYAFSMAMRMLAAGGASTSPLKASAWPADLDQAIAPMKAIGSYVRRLREYRM